MSDGIVKRMGRRLAWSVLLLLPNLAGCGGCGGPSHPPRLRPPADDDEPVVVGTNRRPTPNQAESGSSPTTAAATPNGTNVPTPTAGLPLPANTTPQAAQANQRRRDAKARLAKIYIAMQKYRASNARFPDQAVVDREGKWLLSWRVMLLPYLGRQDLFARFKVDEAWNSPHNLPLSREIPDEFKSPERNDDKTCFQFVTGHKMAYETPAGLSDQTCPDGLIDTVLLVETNPDLAKTWTQPDDYKFDALKIQQDLFTHRQDGAFLLFGGDLGARLLPASVADDKLLGLFTSAGREKVDAEALSLPIGNDPDPTILESLRLAPVTRHVANLMAPATPVPAIAAKGGSVAGDTPNGPAGAVAGATRTGAAEVRSAALSDSRTPVPADEQVSEAAEQIRQLFADEYKSAKKVDERRAFAKKLLDESKRVDADPPAFFVMLRAARDVAAGAGDLATALDAAKRMKEQFQIDEIATFSKVLEQASTQLTEPGAVQLLYDEAMRVTDVAVERDDFAAAKTLLRLAQGAARRQQKQRELAAANRREDEVNSARLAFQKVTPQLLVLLRSPDDPTANAAVGRYTTLVKRDWTKGLELLARGDDSALRELAAQDLSGPTDATAQLAVADAWWELSETTSSPAEKASARARGAYWYDKAIPGLAAGLPRVKAERRVAEMKDAANTKSRTVRPATVTD